MSKYDALWKYIQEQGKERFQLSFTEIEKIAGVPMDHSFLRYKKELHDYGYQVEKISIKKQVVIFYRLAPLFK